jgi:hypothetical protein
MIEAYSGCRVSDGELNWDPTLLWTIIEEEIENHEGSEPHPATEERYVYSDGPSGGRPGVYRLYPDDDPDDDGVLGWVLLYEPRLPG